jgi:hypothetical protein
MSVFSKIALQNDADVKFADNTGGLITPAYLRNFVKDVIDSYQDVFLQCDTATRDGLTPQLGDIIFNTDTNEYNYHNGTSWVNFGIGGSGSSFNVVTRAQLLAAIAAQTINVGAWYLITDAQSTNGICVVAQVLVYGTSSTTVSRDGIRFMLSPNYDVANGGLLIWKSTLTPTAGDKVIWGARVWENDNGLVGAATDDYTLDSEWTEVTYVAGSDYTLEQFECKYDLANDWIEYQCYKGLCIVSDYNYAIAISQTANGCDYSDYKQMDIISIIGLTMTNRYLNNPNIALLSNNEARDICNNLSTSIYNNKLAIPPRMTNDYIGIIGNEADVIVNNHNVSSIYQTPAIDFVGFNTDDESGYFEWNFDDNPLTAGTYNMNCIFADGVALVEMVANSDGNVTPGVNIDLGVDVDDATYFSTSSASINVGVQRTTTIGNRTTAANRIVTMTLDASVSAGKIWVYYKYV